MLQQSIKVSLITVSVEELIYPRIQIDMFRPIRVDHTNCLQVDIKTHSLITRCCGESILSTTLQRHPCPLGSQNYFNKDVCG
jgi:hypothetical protein